MFQAASRTRAAAIACLITSSISRSSLSASAMIVVFNDVAVFDDAHPLFFNLHPLAQQPVPSLRHFAFVPHAYPQPACPALGGIIQSRLAAE
jgi:hypothetical protein